MSLPEIAWAGCVGDAIAWNAVRVTRASLDKQPHNVAAMFDQVADRYDHPAFHKVYAEHLMTALPSVARAVSSNPDSRVYVAESTQAWPDQQGLATEIGRSGSRPAEWRNLTGGIVALHRAIRPA